jgi:thiosulfate dehydrogenase
MNLVHTSLRTLAHAAVALVPIAAVLGACNHAPDTTPDPAAGAAQHEPAAARPRVALQVPGDDTLPAGAEGDLVRRGRQLATHTFEELPALVGSDLHCTSCHLEGGTRANAAPWVGVTSVYPEYRARAGREVTIEDRIGSCFERSLSGRSPAHDSPEMKALVAYMTWLSRDVPRGSEVVGRGFARLERPPNIDSDSGKHAYAVRCASCHGDEGQGKRAEDGSYQFPPLWGERAFNIGAGMGRLDTAASFVRHNMPLGQAETLTAWETYDIAAYFTEQARPDFARKASDWPRGGKPRDARY